MTLEVHPSGMMFCLPLQTKPPGSFSVSEADEADTKEVPSESWGVEVLVD